MFLNQLSTEYRTDAANAGSFEPTRTKPVAQSVVSAIERDGSLRWATTVAVAPNDDPTPLRVTMFASHPQSPAQNLYVVRPGLLVALDQRTGAPSWQLGDADGRELGIPQVRIQFSGAAEHQRIAQTASAAAMKCYLDAATREQVGTGRVYVKLTLDKTGAVTAASLIDSKLKSQSATDCILHVFDALRFPPLERYLSPSVAIEVFFSVPDR